MSAGGTGARLQAIWLLTGHGREVDLEPRDRALAYRMYRETQVWRARLDRALAPLCDRPLSRLDGRVLSALRIGAVQLLILGTPGHAAVSTTVEAMGRHRGRGLVNAVLRKLAANGEPGLDEAPPYLRFSHPRSLAARWTDRYGPDVAADLMEWNNGVPGVGGTVPGQSLDDVPGETSGRYLPDYRELQRAGELSPSDIPEGMYIQDEANVIVARAASALAVGGRVLEIGAAPGGKTHHLHSTAGSVVSVDRSPGRLHLWQANRSRLGWERCFPVAASGDMLPFSDGFDLVFVDAPCTNTGVYRRRSDARWSWSDDLLTGCVKLQRSLLAAGAGATAEGGVLFYSTCSLEPEEDIEQVEWFEKGFPGYSRISLHAPVELVSDGLISIFPPESRMDGIFAAAWRRDQ